MSTDIFQHDDSTASRTVAKAAVNVADLLRKLDPAQLSQLVELQERIEDRRAGRDFAEAFARFQEECPLIPKNRQADFATRSGGRMAYMFADINQILDVVRPVLARHGFSLSWDSQVESGTLTSTCWLRHANGHRECAKFTVPTATNAGMSEQQKIASAGTFADRNSLIRVLGIRAGDEDADGASPQSAEKIAPGRVAMLERLIREAGADRVRFLAFAGVQKIEDILESRVGELMAKLEEKRAAKGGAS